MNASRYLEQLQNDFEVQGLGTTRRGDLSDRPDWSALRDILYLTRHAGHKRHREAASKNPVVTTELGKLVLEYGQNEASIPFSGGRGYTCCSGAEHLLLHSTSPESVKNDDHISPVVVVNGREPVAMIKGFQEMTSYGLRTDLAAGIIAGVFSQPPHHVLRRMRRSAVPFYLDIAEHGTAQLLRFGGFLVPAPVRDQLRSDPSRGVTAAPSETQEQLIRRAQELLLDAIPLPSADEDSIQIWAVAERDRYMQFA